MHVFKKHDQNNPLWEIVFDYCLLIITDRWTHCTVYIYLVAYPLTDNRQVYVPLDGRTGIFLCYFFFSNPMPILSVYNCLGQTIKKVQAVSALNRVFAT